MAILLKRLASCAMVACLGTMAWAGQGKGKGKSHKEKDQSAVGVSTSGTSVNVNLRFGSNDTRVIYDYYRPRVQQLPPGLQKKVARGGTLPPGWQKKVQPFPAELNGRLGPVPVGYRRVISGQLAMLVYDATNTVMDIIDLTR